MKRALYHFPPVEQRFGQHHVKVGIGLLFASRDSYGYPVDRMHLPVYVFLIVLFWFLYRLYFGERKRIGIWISKIHLRLRIFNLLLPSSF